MHPAPEAPGWPFLGGPRPEMPREAGEPALRFYKLSADRHGALPASFRKTRGRALQEAGVPARVATADPSFINSLLALSLNNNVLIVTCELVFCFQLQDTNDLSLRVAPPWN